MELYKVGQIVCPPGQPDGVIFDMTDAGGVLYIRMNKPTAREKRDFKQGLSLRVAMVEGVIFLLVRMGTGQWMDAPYYSRLSDLNNLEYPAGPTDGYGIQAMLIDGATGILVGMKLIGMDHDVSLRLYEAIRIQPEIPDYYSHVNRVLSRYSTTNLLALADKPIEI